MSNQAKELDKARNFLGVNRIDTKTVVFNKQGDNYYDLIDLLTDFAKSQTEWVSVDKRLPEEEQEVMFCNINIKHPVTKEYCDFDSSGGFYRKGYFYSWVDTFDKHSASHWIALPQPPTK